MESKMIFGQPTLGKTEKVIQFVKEIEDQKTKYKQISEANK